MTVPIPVRARPTARVLGLGPAGRVRRLDPARVDPVAVPRGVAT